MSGGNSVFGSYAIIDEVQHDFEKEPKLWWKIKPVTSGDELEYSKFMLHNRMYRDRNGNHVELPPTWLESAHREIALSFHSTNIPLLIDEPVAKGGKPILEPGATVEEIELILAAMPQDMVMEIWAAVGEAYPKWGPSIPNPRAVPEK